MNIHDEIMAPIKSEYIPELDRIVNTFIEDMKDKIPLIEIDWSNNIATWADK